MTFMNVVIEPDTRQFRFLASGKGRCFASANPEALVADVALHAEAVPRTEPPVVGCVTNYGRMEAKRG